MFCNKCGNYVDENSGARFCNKCGNDLSKIMQSIKAEEVIKSEEKVEVQEVKTQEVKTQEVSEEVKKSRKRKLWAVIIVSCTVWTIICWILVGTIINNFVDNLTTVGNTNTNTSLSDTASDDEDEDTNTTITDEDILNNKSEKALSKEESAKKFKEEGKRVGSADYGYISVPKNWARFYDIDGNSTIQYSYGNTWIATIYAVDAEQMDAVTYASGVYSSLEDDGVSNLSAGKVAINDYVGYQVTCYYASENIYLACWFIDGNDGKTHYIAVEGPDYTSDYFYNIVLTFDEDE